MLTAGAPERIASHTAVISANARSAVLVAAIWARTHHDGQENADGGDGRPRPVAAPSEGERGPGKEEAAQPAPGGAHGRHAHIPHASPAESAGQPSHAATAVPAVTSSVPAAMRTTAAARTTARGNT